MVLGAVIPTELHRFSFPREVSFVLASKNEELIIYQDQSTSHLKQHFNSTSLSSQPSIDRSDRSNLFKIPPSHTLEQMVENIIDSLHSGNDQDKSKQLNDHLGLRIDHFEMSKFKTISSSEINDMNSLIEETAFIIDGEAAQECPPTNIETDNTNFRILALLIVIHPFFVMANKMLCITFPSLVTQLILMLELLKDRVILSEWASKDVHISYLLPYAFGRRAYHVAKMVTRLDVHTYLHNNQHEYIIENPSGVLTHQARDIPHDHQAELIQYIISSDITSNCIGQVQSLTNPTTFIRPFDNWNTDTPVAFCYCNGSRCMHPSRRHRNIPTPRPSLQPQHQTGISNLTSDSLSRNSSNYPTAMDVDEDSTHNNEQSGIELKTEINTLGCNIDSTTYTVRYNGETTRTISPYFHGKMGRGRLLNIQSDSSSAGSLFDSSSSDGYIPEDDDSNNSHWYYGPQSQVVYDQNHTPPIPVNIKIEDTSQN